jgi:hypothetical protein
MARFKNYLLVVIGFAVAGMIGAAFGTGTAQAVVSTLVSVLNPNTSPVPSLNVADPGRIAYQATVNNLGKCANQGCSFGFPTAPAGHRVVVQHITAEVSLTGAQINVGVEFQGAIGGSGEHPRWDSHDAFLG